MQGMAYKWSLRNNRSWEYGGKSFSAVGTMSEQKASRKPWDACPAWVQYKCLEGSNDRKNGKSELIPESRELWIQDERIWIFSADNGESLKDCEEGQNIF